MSTPKSVYSKYKISVILPTYCEKDNIPIMIYLLMKTQNEYNLDMEVVIVDDNSPDGTQDRIREL